MGDQRGIFVVVCSRGLGFMPDKWTPLCYPDKMFWNSLSFYFTTGLEMRASILIWYSSVRVVWRGWTLKVGPSERTTPQPPPPASLEMNGVRSRTNSRYCPFCHATLSQSFLWRLTVPIWLCNLSWRDYVKHQASDQNDFKILGSGLTEIIDFVATLVSSIETFVLVVIP